jgi:hypothetical protein
VSKHWTPDEDLARVRQQLPPGALAGLIVLAVACAGVVLVLDRAFGRSDVFAEEIEADSGS